MTQIIWGLLRKDLFKIDLWLFVAMITHMTGKFVSGQTEPTADVTNMFGLKSAWYWGQLLNPNWSFQDKVFDSPYFKCFTHRQRNSKAWFNIFWFFTTITFIVYDQIMLKASVSARSLKLSCHELTEHLNRKSYCNSRCCWQRNVCVQD